MCGAFSTGQQIQKKIAFGGPIIKHNTDFSYCICVVTIDDGKINANNDILDSIRLQISKHSKHFSLWPTRGRGDVFENSGGGEGNHLHIQATAD